MSGKHRVTAIPALATQPSWPTVRVRQGRRVTSPARAGHPAYDAVLDGFIIEYGYAMPGDGDAPVGEAADILDIADGMEDEELLRVLEGYLSVAGGGMLNIQVAPQVANTTFRYNSAAKGGAVYNMVATEFPLPPPEENDWESATFTNTTFHSNTGFARGGAINNDSSTSPSFYTVAFIDNIGEDKGGALYDDAGCEPDVINGLFVGNTAERGTAMVSSMTDEALSPRQDAISQRACQR